MRRNVGGHGGGYILKLSLSSLIYYTKYHHDLHHNDHCHHHPSWQSWPTSWSLSAACLSTDRPHTILPLQSRGGDGHDVDDDDDDGNNNDDELQKYETFDVDEYGDRQHAIVPLQTSGHDADKIPRKIAIFDNHDEERDMNKTQPGGPGRGWSWLYWRKCYPNKETLIWTLCSQKKRWKFECSVLGSHQALHFY